MPWRKWLSTKPSPRTVSTASPDHSAAIPVAAPAALGFVGAASIVGALILASAIMREKTAAARAELQLATTKQL